MLKTKYIISLVVLSVLICVGLITTICSLSSSKSKPTIEIIKETRSFPNKTLSYNWQSLEDDRIVYVVCDDESTSKCQIKQEKYPFNPNSVHSCNITFANGTVQHPYIVFAMPFGENRAILLWDDFGKEEKSEAGIRITVVHLNECRQAADFILNGGSQELVFRLSYARNIVTYNDTFDIFFKDSKLCPNETICKLTINDEGQAIGGPVEFLKNSTYYLRNVYPIAAHSPAKGYVYSKYFSGLDDTGAYLMLSNGTEKYLEPTGKYYGVSVVNEMIGMCSRPALYASNITCSLFNANGELRFNVSYNSTVRPYTNTSDVHSHMERIYTLPDEGFILQFFEIVKCNNVSDCVYPSTTGYYMVKVDKTGKEVGKFYSKEFDRDFTKDEYRHFWKNEDKKNYCTMLINDKELNSFNLTTTCFTDAMFS